MKFWIGSLEKSNRIHDECLRDVVVDVFSGLLIGLKNQRRCDASEPPAGIGSWKTELLAHGELA